MTVHRIKQTEARPSHQTNKQKQFVNNEQTSQLHITLNNVQQSTSGDLQLELTTIE